MPAPKPLEFHRRAVALARLREKPIAQIARNLRVTESCVRNWMARADIDEGKREGLTTAEHTELAGLCRANRVLAMEVEIVKRPSACFARENILPR